MSDYYDQELSKPSKQCVHEYLTLICIAVRECNDNRGTLRKDLWAYLMKEYPKTIDYRYFLLCISELLQNGQLRNKDGYYFVDKNVYNEQFQIKDQEQKLTSKNNDYLKILEQNHKRAQYQQKNGRASVKPISQVKTKPLAKVSKEQTARSMSVLPLTMGGQKVQAKISSYFASTKKRHKTTTEQQDNSLTDSLPDPMGDIKSKLNIYLEDDESSNQAANKTPKETPVKKFLGLVELNQSAQSNQNDAFKISSTQITDSKANLGYLGLQRDTQIQKSQEKIQARDLESFIPTINPWYDSSPEEKKQLKVNKIEGKNSTKLPQSKTIKKTTPKLKTPVKLQSLMITPKKYELRTPIKSTIRIKSPSNVTSKLIARKPDTPTLTMQLRSSAKKPSVTLRKLKTSKNISKTMNQSAIRDLFGQKKFSKPSQGTQQIFVYQKGQKFMRLQNMTSGQQKIVKGKNTKTSKTQKNKINQFKTRRTPKKSK